MVIWSADALQGGRSFQPGSYNHVFLAAVGGVGLALIA
jgi:hypothetical protein